jgi:hypothetical protein
MLDPPWLGLEDVFVNMIKVISNIPLPCEDKVDGCRYLKVNLKCFIQ